MNALMHLWVNDDIYTAARADHGKLSQRECIIMSISRWPPENQTVQDAVRGPPHINMLMWKSHGSEMHAWAYFDFAMWGWIVLT